MFTKMFKERVPEETGDTLWNQCLKELMRINHAGRGVPIEEVDRLAKLVSHRIRGDFTPRIQEVSADAVNGFMDGLPF